MADELTYEQTVDRWQELQDIIPKLQAEERSLREGLFYGTFKDPQEGVNKFELPDGRVLKGTYKLNRYVKDDQVPSLPPELRDKVLKTKFDLKVGPYKKLDEETRKQVDGILTIKPGLPTLEIVEPKDD